MSDMESDIRYFSKEKNEEKWNQAHKLSYMIS